MLVCVGCGAAPVANPKTAHRPEDPLAHWDATPKAALAWNDFDAKTFARARSEKKFIVMDGSAEWCHWCHVMEAVTYHDAAVRSEARRAFHRGESRRRRAPRHRRALRRIRLARDGDLFAGGSRAREIPRLHRARSICRNSQRGRRERRKFGGQDRRRRSGDQRRTTQ